MECGTIELSLWDVLKLTDPKHLIVQYAIMWDCPPERLIEYSANNPDVFVFPFYSGTLNDFPDHSILLAFEDNKIMCPIYIGRLDSRAAQVCIKSCFDELKKYRFNFHKVHTEYYTTKKEQ